MAPARHVESKQRASNNKAVAKKSASGHDMDRKSLGKANSKKSKVQDNINDKKEPWFEDKSPGDGQSENSFLAMYNTTLSWEDELESSKNKSWFDLVEEDEAEDLNPSRKDLSNTPSIDIKIKEEVFDEHEDSDHNHDVLDYDLSNVEYDVQNECQQKVSKINPGHKAHSVPPAVIKSKKVSDPGQNKTLHISIKQENCEDIVIKKEKNIDSCLRYESTNIISVGSKECAQINVKQQRLEQTSIKQEKYIENIPAKCKRSTTSAERVDSNNRRGKRMKQEVLIEDKSEAPAKQKTTRDLHTSNCDMGKLVKQPKDELHKECRVKKETYTDKEGSSGILSVGNRKRNFESSTESIGVKRERSGSNTEHAGVKQEHSGSNTKRERIASSSSGSTASSLPRKKEYERDPEVLVRRQKQIDYGKNTVGYDRYRQQIPKEMRTIRHPRTPPKHIKYSRRAWDGIVKIWRQQLHVWDPDAENNELHDSALDTSVEASSVTSDDIFSDCPRSDTQASTSSASGSVDDIHEYLNLEHEDLDNLID